MVAIKHITLIVHCMSADRGSCGTDGNCAVQPSTVLVSEMSLSSETLNLQGFQVAVQGVVLSLLQS